MYTLLVTVPLVGGPGLIEMLLIGAVILIFFGTSKLPQLGKGLGEGIRNFKTGLKGKEKESKTGKDETLPAEKKEE